MRAARRFDPDRGIRFATYARWWVRAQMTRALETTGRTVRVPGGAVEQARNLRIAAGRFEREGVQYTIEDLAREVGLDAERAEFLLSQGHVVSMDEPGEDGGTLGDRIPSEDEAGRPEERAIQKDVMDRISDAMGGLDPRERFVIEHHYGLIGGETHGDSHTMAEIGKSIGLSRERVRQIEAAAIHRLRGIVT
jgi:RNA polymerase sigma factor (sigma-70 family)